MIINDRIIKISAEQFGAKINNLVINEIRQSFYRLEFKNTVFNILCHKTTTFFNRWGETRGTQTQSQSKPIADEST